MNWREALLIASENARMRSDHYREPAPGGSNDPETLAYARGRASAYNVMAEELHFISTLPPHEGLKALRKLGRRARKLGGT